ncbi:hypothetical protein HPP92_007311 [Vanilla planifolia]|uniref:Uncharacterized protein n=1 Tax=Vanilla planifolia TaxID=51239 RepID=A0A835V9A6_VANPL|nr:hypothetical protein HPP92_007311 [Vanilla planifolia]
MSPAASPGGHRIRRRLSCLPTCFSSPSVCDADDQHALSPESRSPKGKSLDAFLWSRIRGQNRTVPVEDVSAKEMSWKESSIVIASVESRRKDFLQKLHEEPNESKVISKSLAHKRYDHQQLNISQISPKYISHYIQSKSTFHHTHDLTQVRNRTNHQSTPKLSTPIASSQMSRECLKTHSILLLLAMALVVTVFIGRLCAVFCTCAWLYLLPSNLSPNLLSEKTFIEAIDVDSTQYKKMVVLMGLLDRDRSRFSGATSIPITSPTKSR